LSQEAAASQFHCCEVVSAVWLLTQSRSGSPPPSLVRIGALRNIFISRALMTTSAPLQSQQRIAIVGSGISGLASVHALQGKAHITLFEAADYIGGHTHTVDVTLPGVQGLITHGVDTGFLVFNERTYRN